MSRPKEALIIVTVLERKDSDIECDDGGTVRARTSTRLYNEGWERIFGTNEEEATKPEDLN